MSIFLQLNFRSFDFLLQALTILQWETKKHAKGNLCLSDSYHIQTIYYHIQTIITLLYYHHGLLMPVCLCVKGSVNIGQNCIFWPFLYTLIFYILWSVKNINGSHKWKKQSSVSWHSLSLFSEWYRGSGLQKKVTKCAQKNDILQVKYFLNDPL